MRSTVFSLSLTALNFLLVPIALAAYSQSAFSQAPVPQNGSAGTPQRQQQPQRGWSSQQQSQAWATLKLAASPRHSEWITIPNGGRTLKAWVDYPQVKGKVPAVLVLHEVFGLTDSTRNTADEIAAMGYITISIDMLAGRGPNGGNVDSFEPPLSASDTLTSLPDDAVNSDLNAWADYAKKLPASNGMFAIVGLSWGGGAAFRYAATAQRKDLKAVCVFYDVGLPAETQHFAGAPTSIPVDKIGVPIYGFYGSTDTRPFVTIDATKTAMAAAGKFYEPVVYQGADHAFMRVGESPSANPANVAAVKAASERLEKLLKDSFK